MYNFNDNNKKPSTFPLSSSADQNLYNWTFKSDLNDSSDIMMFNGSQERRNNANPSTSGINLINQPRRVKRKSECPNYFPNKIAISEEKLIKHINGMHISSEFQAHNINLSDNQSDIESSSVYSVNVNLSPQELETRLKNAQKIILCEDVKKTLYETSKNEIYKVLANRYEKPCQAIVLWQPPQPLEKLITDFKSVQQKDNNDNEDDQTKNEERMIE